MKAKYIFYTDPTILKSDEMWNLKINDFRVYVLVVCKIMNIFWNFLLVIENRNEESLSSFL